MLQPYPHYRGSGIEWLGGIPEGWNIGKFRHVFRESSELNGPTPVGQMLSVSGYRGVEFKVYDDENRKRSDADLETYRVVRPGQLAVNTMWLNYAGLGVSELTGHMSPAYRAYKIVGGVHARFMHHLMRCSLYVTAYTGELTGVRPNSLQMSRSTLMEWPVVLPTLDEQRQIADYLDTHTAKIDTLIGKQERLISALREKRQSIIDGHFEPSKVNRPLRLRNLLVARPTYGVLVPVYVETDDSVPFIRVGDLARLDAVSPLAQISEAQSTEYSRTRIVGGEVLLGVVGKMGQVAIAPERLAGANVARAVAVLRCTDRATSELLAIWLTSTMFLDQAGLSTSGDSVQPTLGMGDLAVVGIQWPKDAETGTRVLLDLKHQIALIDDLKAKAERFIELLKERRAALITAAVTGKIDVRGLA